MAVSISNEVSCTYITIKGCIMLCVTYCCLASTLSNQNSLYCCVLIILLFMYFNNQSLIFNLNPVYKCKKDPILEL